MTPRERNLAEIEAILRNVFPPRTNFEGVRQMTDRTEAMDNLIAQDADQWSGIQCPILPHEAADLIDAALAEQVEAFFGLDCEMC